MKRKRQLNATEQKHTGPPKGHKKVQLPANMTAQQAPVLMQSPAAYRVQRKQMA
jgi:hypothetical protein